MAGALKSPTLVHPKLDGVTRLGTTTVPPRRGDPGSPPQDPLMRRAARGPASRGRGRSQGPRRHREGARGTRWTWVPASSCGPYAARGAEQFVEAIALRGGSRRLRPALAACPT